MRRRYVPVIFALLLIAGAFLLLACNGDDSDNTNNADSTPAPTDLARTTCKPSGSAGQVTPATVPQGFEEFTSLQRGYSVAYPSGWQAKPNAVAVSNITGDAFFSGETSGKITANMSITCETVPIGATSGDFIDAKRSVLQRTTGKLPDIMNTLTVNGSEAASVEYAVQATQEGETLAIDKIEVYFADEMGGWTITLAVPLGTVDTYRADFDTLVQSYRRP